MPDLLPVVSLEPSHRQRLICPQISIDRKWPEVVDVIENGDALTQRLPENPPRAHGKDIMHQPKIGAILRLNFPQLLNGGGIVKHPCGLFPRGRRFGANP